MRRQNAYVANESSIHPRSDVTETENGEWKRGTATGNEPGDKGNKGKGKIKHGKKKNRLNPIPISNFVTNYLLFPVPRSSN